MCYDIGTLSRGIIFSMFFGEFFHQIDDKNRIRIPTPFKSELGASFYFAKGLDGVINILPVKMVEEQLLKLQTISDFDADGQDALLEYTSSVYFVSEDKQGRVRIPDALVEFAHIEKDGYSDKLYYYQYTNDYNKSAPNIYIMRDSYSIAMVPFLKDSFYKSTYNWTFEFSKSAIQKAEADIIMVIVAERNLRNYVNNQAVND